MAILYPRLSPPDALSLRESCEGIGIDELRVRSEISHPNQFFASVGGRRVDAEELSELQAAIRGIAGAVGYPQTALRNAASDFDTNVSIYLGEQLGMPRGEALRPQTWAFFSLVLLPDVVKWRFPSFNVSRCTGGRRDCFQRLWLRAQAFDLGKQAEDRWVLLKSLTEDAFVSIIERPSLAGNPEICKVLGTAWTKTAAVAGRSNMEEINRRAIKRIRAKGTFILLDALDRRDLKSLVEECYQAEADRIAGQGFKARIGRLFGA